MGVSSITNTTKEDTHVFEIAHQTVVPPAVYRFMDKRYVDKFFDTGELKLSSFRSFSKHADESRRDGSDGKSIHFIRTKSGQSLFVPLIMNTAPNVLVLCGTANDYLRSSWYKPRNRHAIVICDQVGFGLQVAIELKVNYGLDVKLMANGYCIYRTAGLELLADSFDIESFKKLTKEERQHALVNFIGPRHFFRKGLRYSHEVEFRWIWVSKNECPENLVVTIPEPTKYCFKHETYSYIESLKYKLFGKTGRQLVEEADRL